MVGAGIIRRAGASLSGIRATVRRFRADLAGL
jgi:hypothetical protein